MKTKNADNKPLFYPTVLHINLAFNYLGHSIKLFGTYLLFFIITFTQSVKAQLAGSWTGEMIYKQAIFPAQLSLKVVGQKVSGQISLNINGLTETSMIDAQVMPYTANKSANGKITDAQNNAANILLGIDGQQLNISISIDAQYGGGSMVGRLNRSGGVSHQPQTASPSRQVVGPAPKLKQQNTDGLTRDPYLIGKWFQVKKHTKSDYNSDTYFSFYQDGTLEETTRTSIISYGNDINISDIGDFEPNKDLLAAMNAGVRWFTKTGKICVMATDGKTTCNMAYHFEDNYNYLFIQASPGAKNTPYKRSN